jgi:TolA-binding protein
MESYTFRMKQLIWLVALGALVAIGYGLMVATRRYNERKRASEARFAEFMAQTMKPKTDAAAPAVVAPATAAPAPDLATQKLLFEAAAKAGEAGEPALAIQLYARLIARYPNGAFVAQARAAVETQKSRIARPQSSA